MTALVSIPVFQPLDDVRKSIVGFVELMPGWDNNPAYVSISVLGRRGGDGKKHVKAENGRANFSLPRATHFVAALNQLLESPEAITAGVKQALEAPEETPLDAS